jgi:hypothetical protein
MAATYVKITRLQFEDWLFDICPVFERDEKTQGIYLCPLSRHVSVKVSSSIGRTSKVMAAGDASCKMTLVSRHTGRSLRKAPGAPDDANFRKCNRTKGWLLNWRTALKEMFASFKRNRDHYNLLAQQTQAEYAQEWVARIEGVRDYFNFNILVDCRNAVLDGKWLTPNQETAVWKFVNPRRKSSKKPSKKTGTPRASTKGLTGREQLALSHALDRLEARAEGAKDEWTVKFASGNVRSRVRNGKSPTTRQTEILREKLRKYKIHVPQVIAA